jgi:hypothetical protein
MLRWKSASTSSRRIGANGLRIIESQNVVPKPDYIFDLERRQQVLEEEIARALSHCSADDPMVGDLKSRMLHLKEEIERFCNEAIADRRLH